MTSTFVAAPSNSRNISLARKVAANPELLDGLSNEEIAALEYDWEFWARPNQIEPPEFARGEYFIWLLLAGRGFGKTRVGSETTNKRVREGRASLIALVAPTAADARDIMVEGPSGIIATSPPWFKAVYHPSRREVTWPNGAKAIIFSAEDPDQSRGSQQDWAWCDELAAWSHLTMQSCWDNLMMGLRVGAAQCMVTTTPRPIKIVRDLMKRESVYKTRGSTYENLANLAPSFREQIVETYEGTRLGRQELYAEILEDTPGALWTDEMISRNRIINPEDCPPLKRVAVAIDPAGSRDGHEVGIVGGGIAYDGQGYLLADRSMNGRPDEWGQAALALYDELEADCIVVETNFGGEMVASVIHNIRPEAPVREVRATRGKAIRAQPVSMLSERNLIHHVGRFDLLEDQLTTWLVEEGPNDRLDAYVWLFTDLMPAQIKGRLWFV